MEVLGPSDMATQALRAWKMERMPRLEAESVGYQMVFQKRSLHCSSLMKGTSWPVRHNAGEEAEVG